MKKNIVRLTESDLHKVVKKSVNRLLREYMDDIDGWDYDYETNTDDSFTVGELISELSKYPQEAKVATKINNGYQTFNSIDIDKSQSSEDYVILKWN